MSHEKFSGARRRRHVWLGSSFSAVVLSLAAAWSFARCSALPDDRCMEDGIGPDVYFHEGCMICVCDAAGELHCYPGNCSPDAGMVLDSTASVPTESELP
jgi:hypothetical protein